MIIMIMFIITNRPLFFLFLGEANKKILITNSFWFFFSSSSSSSSDTQNFQKPQENPRPPENQKHTKSTLLVVSFYVSSQPPCKLNQNKKVGMSLVFSPCASLHPSKWKQNYSGYQYIKKHWLLGKLSKKNLNNK
jgi:hypothetical protein